ncbi:MAG: TonB C-terminal domain-containing protein [Candidatus Caenarcaniphilales bacterium]|nr:TonB C-terminal domain-containing protein [Candidatus Caenarcaniphilales bacterium]
MPVQDKPKSTFSSGIYNQINSPKESYGFELYVPGLPHIVFGKQEIKGYVLLATFIVSLLCLAFVLIPGLSQLIGNLLLNPLDNNYERIISILNFPTSFRLITSVTVSSFIVYLIFENYKDLKSKFRIIEKDLKPSLFTASFSGSYLANISLLITIIFYGLFFNFSPIEKEKTIEIEMVSPFVDNPIVKKPPKKAPKNAKRVAVQNAVNSGRFNKKLPLSPGISQPKPKPKSATPRKPSKSAKPSPYKKPSRKKSFKPFPKSAPKPKASRPKSLIPSFKPKANSKTSVSSSNNSSTKTPRSLKPLYKGSSSSSSSSRKVAFSGSPSRGPVLPSRTSGFSSGAGLGNSGPNNNPNGPITVAARKDVDYGPFMQDLQRRIQQAWKPSGSDKQDKVILSFTLKKNGTLVPGSLRTVNSSNPLAEAAARQAVLAASPGFRPLPDGAADQVRIDFTFTRTGTRFMGLKKY